MDVHAVRIEREIRRFHFLVVHGDEHQVDVGPDPDSIVRQAAAQDGREYRAVLLHRVDEAIERRGKPLLNRSLFHGGLERAGDSLVPKLM